MNYVKKYFYNPTYRLARNFCGSLFLRIADFLRFAGTNFCDFGQSGYSFVYFFFINFFFYRMLQLLITKNEQLNR